MSNEGKATDGAEREKSDEGSDTNSVERVMRDEYIHWTERYWPKPRLYPNRDDTSKEAKRYFRRRYGKYSTAYSVALGRPERLQRLLEKLLRSEWSDAGLDEKARQRLRSLRLNVNLLCQAIGLQIGQREAGARRKKKGSPVVNRSHPAVQKAADDLRAKKQEWLTKNPPRKYVPRTETISLLQAVMLTYASDLPNTERVRGAVLNAEKRGGAKAVTTVVAQQETQAF